MKELGILLLAAIAAMGILLIILLQKITILKKQTDDIVKEVNAYVAYVTKETEEEEIQSAPAVTPEKAERGRLSENISKEEAQSRIIQAVLGEYFP